MIHSNSSSDSYEEHLVKIRRVGSIARFVLFNNSTFTQIFDLLKITDEILGAEIRSVCTEAGMFAIRARRKVATEKDFLEAINKVRSALWHVTIRHGK